MSGSVPFAMLVQVPRLPATSQAWQVPEQVELQQRPSTQLPELHWLEAEQLVPFEAFGRQVLPPPQKKPLAHWESVVQLEPQALPLQT